MVENLSSEPTFADSGGSISFEFNDHTFESMARVSKKRGNYWLASEIAVMLGYSSLSSLQPAIRKAQQASLSIGINVDENFARIPASGDWGLTRFGCYLVAMNGNVSKPEVAAAQIYFAVMAEGFRQYVEQAENMERVLLRDEISEQEKSLSAAAHGAGVEQYGYFQSAGYRGLYNMSLKKLKIKKGIPDGKSPLDFMRRNELAANLFRLTQTEEKIRKNDIRGQKNLEDAAFGVGRKVRETCKS